MKKTMMIFLILILTASLAYSKKKGSRKRKPYFPSLPTLTIKPDFNMITVKGSACLIVKPDEVMVSVKIEVKDKSVDEAKTKLDKKIESFKNAMGDLKVNSIVEDERLMKRASNRNYQAKTTEVDYKAYTRLSIHFNDPDLIQDVISQSFKGGASAIIKVSKGISLKKMNDYRKQCTDLAIKAGKKKARYIAKKFKKRLSKLVFISLLRGLGVQKNPYLNHKSILSGRYIRDYNRGSSYWRNYDIVKNISQEKLSYKLMIITAEISVGYSFR